MLSTARAVMINQMGIPYVYTIETSVGIYYSYEEHHDKPLVSKKCEELGESIAKAIQQYYESICQYEQFIALRKQENERMQSSSHRKVPSLVIKNQRQSNTEKKNTPTGINTSLDFYNKKKLSLSLKEVSLIKIIEDIKILQEKNNRRKQEVVSDASSDSQNEEDLLEKNKLLQFQGMVTQCIQTEKYKKQKQSELQSQSFEQKQQEDLDYLRRRNAKIKIKSMKKDIMKDLLKNCAIKKEKQKVNQQRKEKIVDQALVFEKKHKTGVKNINNRYLIYEEEGPTDVDKQMQSYFENQQEFRKKKAPNMINLNFSQMIEQPISRTMTCDRQKRQRYLLNLADIEQKRKRREYETVSFDFKSIGFSRKYCKLNLQSSINHDQQAENSGKFQTHSEYKDNKNKGTFPAHFYRIKYQNNQRKKQKIFEEEKQIAEDSVDKRWQNSYAKRNKQKGIDFFHINKFGQFK